MKSKMKSNHELLNSFQEENNAKKSALKKIIRALDSDIKNLKSTKDE